MKNIDLGSGPLQTDILDNTTRFIQSKTLGNFIMAQGYFHGKDRLVQMEMLRIISKGRLCELIMDSDETLAIDKFMRELGLYFHAQEEVKCLSLESTEVSRLYCQGVNKAILENHPFEFKLIGHRPDKWTITDIIVTLKVMSFLGLAQGQQDLQKFIIQQAANGIDTKKIKSLVNNELPELSKEIIGLLKKVNLYNPLIPKSYKFLQKLPKIQASNNWLCKNSDDPENILHACDPHLDCNRLPGVWYEMSVKIKKRNYFGISMPGVPGIVMGRNDQASFSFTYGFMDMIDYFIEEIRDGEYRVGESFEPIKVRVETIKRKKFRDVEIKIRETRNGVLEIDCEKRTIPNGFYLSNAWSCRETGASDSLESLIELFEVTTAIEIKEIVKKVAISCNWLIADNQGSMIYQQSGILPKRKFSGLIPIEGWKCENIWQGYYQGSELQYEVNPECDYIVTANNKIELDEFPASINAPMANYRHDRIEQILSQNKEKLSIDLLKEMQGDVLSLQASSYKKVFESILEQSQIGRDIMAWDNKYDIQSKGAVLFEKFYKQLIVSFFNSHLLERDGALYCYEKTSLVSDFYGLVDRLFLSSTDDEIWFNEKSKDQYVKECLAMLDSQTIKDSKTRWGQVNNIDMNNIFFDGKLPAFLGFDHKNVPIPGNRATITQGAIFEAHGRKSTFCPAWKMVTAMGKKELFTVMAGGLSDRRFSKYYKSDLQNWTSGYYRKNSV